MTAILILLVVVCIALPLAFAWRLWRLDEPTRLGLLLVVGESAVFVTLIGLLGRWDVAGMWSRMALMGLVIVAAAASIRRHRRRPWLPGDGPSLWYSHSPAIASLVLFGAALVYVMAGMVAQHDPRNLAFPLEDGRFVVTHGGDIGILNHHNEHLAQRHALDITAVNAMGVRASGFLPKDPGDYAIYGKSVVSPCDGTVVAVVDGLPDLEPPKADKDNPAGNHVILSCGDMKVELAHLRSGTLAVEPGQSIFVGQAIGQVGNSGNSTEPHLHIHAVDVRSGTGIQMSFDGVVPVRNTLFYE